MCYLYTKATMPSTYGENMWQPLCGKYSNMWNRKMKALRLGGKTRSLHPPRPITCNDVASQYLLLPQVYFALRICSPTKCRLHDA